MATHAQSDLLTIERIIASPSLSGPSIRELKISPDGQRVTFLQGKMDDREQLDLWEYHVGEAERRLLVDSGALVAEEILSEEEKARRERQRLGGLRGIVDYSWSDNGDGLLIPLGGDLYYFDLNKSPAQAISRLTSTLAFETDARLSSRGNYVSFIRDQNLFILNIASGEETQLTEEGGGTTKYGMAEFIAQEEMDRDTGYWWSEDESRIAFVRVDESPVDIARRYEIYAEDVTVIEQRYPYAGSANVEVALGVVELATKQVTWIDLGEDTDIYLPRVKWLRDSRTLSYQWQPRGQKTLELRFVDTDNGAQRTIVNEASDTWINLNNDLHFLSDDAGFIWASERSGFKHLYLYDLDGRMLRPLTAGDWTVDRVEGINSNMVFFTAAAEAPLEQHLYRQSFDTDTPREPEKISNERGWHNITMNDQASLYLDRYSNTDRPHRISLHDNDGEQLTLILENALDETHPYWPYVANHQATEFGTLTTVTGEPLHYRITKPKGFNANNSYPVFLFVYGGPGGQTVKDEWGSLFEQYMAQRGFIIFSLDNRGSKRRGTTFESAIYGQAGAVEVEDQLIGVEYLKSLDFVDENRIGIFGWSYGGYMTLMSLFKASEEFAAGVAVAPVTDWRLYDTHYTERYLANPKNNEDGYELSSVFPWLEKLEKPLPPLLVIHGMADDNVLFTHSTKLFKVLQDKGLLFDIMTYPGSKHGLSGEATQTHVYNTIAAFFERHLKVESH